jgi:YesN/AraC family two-component response regulator
MASNGLEALQVLGEGSPDLVLLDHVLPDIPGLAILGIIRQMCPAADVILMTGFGSEELAISAFRAGVRDYLKKPISLSDLLTRVESALAARKKESREGIPARRVERWARWKGDRDPRTRRLENAITFIESQLHAPLSLDRVAREAGMSKFHFCRHFKGVTGLTFRAFLARRRIERAVELLREGRRSVTEVYLDVGFKDLSHFGRVFRKVIGQSPSRYRQAAQRTAQFSPSGGYPQPLPAPQSPEKSNPSRMKSN